MSCLLNSFFKVLKSLLKHWIVLFGLLSLTIPLRAQSWPMFRGGPQQTGVFPGELSLPLEPVWMFEIQEGVVATAALEKGVVYLGGRSGIFYALDLETGTEKWSFDGADEIHSSALVKFGKVFFGDERGSFFALQASDGVKSWTFQAGAGIKSSANVQGDSIIFGSYDNFVYCLSAQQYRRSWFDRK